jgi:phage-related protein
MNTKEKATAQMLVWIQPSLYKQFKKVCEKKYSSVSGMVKKLMVKFIEENKNE